MPHYITQLTLLVLKKRVKPLPHLINKMVAVFDTAFHQTMPEEAYLYALPYSLYKDHSIRVTVLTELAISLFLVKQLKC